VAIFIGKVYWKSYERLRVVTCHGLPCVFLDFELDWTADFAMKFTIIIFDGGLEIFSIPEEKSR
jgi:hypothetical protein